MAPSPLAGEGARTAPHSMAYVRQAVLGEALSCVVEVNDKAQPTWRASSSTATAGRSRSSRRLARCRSSLRRALYFSSLTREGARPRVRLMSGTVQPRVQSSTIWSCLGDRTALRAASRISPSSWRSGPGPRPGPCPGAGSRPPGCSRPRGRGRAGRSSSRPRSSAGCRGPAPIRSPAP